MSDWLLVDLNDKKSLEKICLFVFLIDAFQWSYTKSLKIPGTSSWLKGKMTVSYWGWGKNKIIPFSYRSNLKCGYSLQHIGNEHFLKGHLWGPVRGTKINCLFCIALTWFFFQIRNGHLRNRRCFWNLSMFFMKVGKMKMLQTKRRPSHSRNPDCIVTVS